MTHVIALTGYAGVGKDTVARYLVDSHGYARVAFADKLKDLLYESNPIICVPRERRLQELVDELGWDEAKRRWREIRLLLQHVGMGARHVLGDGVWIAPALREARTHSHVVIPDLRLHNELDALRGGIFESVVVLRLLRSDIGPVNDHVTEQPLPHDVEVTLDSVDERGIPRFFAPLMVMISAYRRGGITTLPSKFGPDGSWFKHQSHPLDRAFRDEVDKVRD